jgi:cyclin-dependent kinase 7
MSVRPVLSAPLAPAPHTDAFALFLTPPINKALNHPYFFALPYPTHPSKLPKTAAQTASASARPLDEVDGNVEPSGPAPGAKAAAPSKKLKRKLSGNEISRNIARKLDFTGT